MTRQRRGFGDDLRDIALAHGVDPKASERQAKAIEKVGLGYWSPGGEIGNFSERAI